MRGGKTKTLGKVEFLATQVIKLKASIMGNFKLINLILDSSKGEVINVGGSSDLRGNVIELVQKQGKKLHWS